MNKTNALKLLGVGAMLLSGIATLLGNYVDEKETEAMVEEKVNEALAARDQAEES